MSAKEKDGLAKQYAKDVKKGTPTEWGELTPKQQRAVREHAVKHNADMFPEVSGTKADMHAWQNRQILEYIKQFGKRPSLNKSNY